MDYLFLSEIELFQGSTPGEVQAMLQCLGVKQRKYKKDEFLYRAGDTAAAIGVVLSGGVNIESDDPWGNKSILSHVSPGQTFAEAYACTPGEPLLVNVLANEPTEVLLLDAVRVLQTCPTSCPHHHRLIRNLLAVTARKNQNLSRRIFHTSPKTIRGRLISYLSFESAKQGGSSVTIPFNRQQLADYLGVDRSALSNELSKMRRDGLLEVRKNHFLLKESPNRQA